MSTTVISGRVDTLVARQAQMVLQHAGVTPGEVIKAVWGRIASTGEVPVHEEGVQEGRRQLDALERLDGIRERYASCEALHTLDDAQMKDIIAGHYA